MVKLVDLLAESPMNRIDLTKIKVTAEKALPLIADEAKRNQLMTGQLDVYTKVEKINTSPVTLMTVYPVQYRAEDIVSILNWIADDVRNARCELTNIEDIQCLTRFINALEDIGLIN